MYLNLKANSPAGQAQKIVSQNPETPSPLALIHSSLPAKVFSAQKKAQKSSVAEALMSKMASRC